MSNNTDYFAVTFHGPQLLFNDFLAQVILPLLGSLGEGLLLGFVPSREETIVQRILHGHKSHQLN